MPTLFFKTPEPPSMLTPAAKDHAVSAIYIGILGIIGKFRALSNDAITRGNRV